MDWFAWVIAVFVIVAATDRIFGGKLGLGKELEEGIKLMGIMALSMVGMIVVSPLIAWIFEPVFSRMDGAFDPSVFAGILFANDMGGASLAQEIANDPAIGNFNGLVVASMMGATISYTVPFALGVVSKESHKELLLGLLCGIATIPVGCFFGGTILGLPFGRLMLNLLPLILVAALVVLGLVKFPNASVKIFSGIGVGIKALVTFGLAIGIFEALTGVKLVPHTASISDGIDVVANATYVLAGAFPMLFVVSKLLKKPLLKLGEKIDLNQYSVLGFVSTLASSAPMFGMMDKMDKKGKILNSAFATSGAWTLGGHLAFTMAFNGQYVIAVVVGKLIAGIFSLIIAAFLYKRIYNDYNQRDMDMMKTQQRI